ncbi:MAG: tRNA isopentenyl-2-thiomethyl-A-37 hydroxylase MiaE [Planctomycetota bacterium]
MLSLASVTDAAWGDRALEHLDEILLEQAHLEKKAASAALQLLFRYPDRVALQRPLAALAREELEHFELVLGALEDRGVPFGPQKASPYASRLLRAVRGAEPERLLDTLLCSALIEARSCERMRLMEAALVARGHELAPLYHELVGSEARHHALYVQLAKGEFEPALVDARLAQLAAHEAQVVTALPELPRLHA